MTAIYPTSSATVSEPASEPVSLVEAKRHLTVSQSFTEHDTEISAMIKAARQQWEVDTQHLSVQRSVSEVMDIWPTEDFRLTYGPVFSVSSLEYYDTDNIYTVLSAQEYVADLPKRRVLLSSNSQDSSFPSIYDRHDAVTITYLAGKTTTDELIKHAIKLKLDVFFDLRGMTKDKDAAERAYEGIVKRYIRGSYP